MDGWTRRGAREHRSGAAVVESVVLCRAQVSLCHVANPLSQGEGKLLKQEQEQEQGEWNIGEGKVWSIALKET